MFSVGKIKMAWFCFPYNSELLALHTLLLTIVLGTDKCTKEIRYENLHVQYWPAFTHRKALWESLSFHSFTSSSVEQNSNLYFLPVLRYRLQAPHISQGDKCMKVYILGDLMETSKYFEAWCRIFMKTWGNRCLEWSNHNHQASWAIESLKKIKSHSPWASGIHHIFQGSFFFSSSWF